LTGPIKIKVPTTLRFLRLNALVREFAELHPDVDVVHTESLIRAGMSSEIG
jgi:hypothetical protein